MSLFYVYVYVLYEVFFIDNVVHLGPDLQAILRQSYDYLSIMQSYDRLTTDV